MIKLKDLLQITFANRFVIRDADNDNTLIWQGRKYESGYDVMKDTYSEYEVHGIRTHKYGVVYIDIAEESFL